MDLPDKKVRIVGISNTGDMAGRQVEVTIRKIRRNRRFWTVSGGGT